MTRGHPKKERVRRARVDGGPRGADLVALVVRQVVVSLAIGWGLAWLLCGVFVLLGSELGDAMIRALLVEGVAVLAIGVVSLGVARHEGPSVWGGRFGRLGSSGGTPPGYGLTLSAECFLVAIPMLAIAMVLGK